MRLLSATITAAAMAALAALPAQAATCRHLPGQGAIDQYCEIIPSGAGERPDRTGDGGGSAPLLPAQTSKALRAAGADGSGVASLANTSPAPQLSAQSGAESGGDAGVAAGKPSSTSGAAGSDGHTTTEPAPSSGTLQALVGDVDGTGGRGWLPWALLAIAAAAGITAWMRRGRWS